MCLAISPDAMRMIEAITIYLAAGAPFGVSYFLQREQKSRASALTLLRATGTALLWPLAAVTIVLARKRWRTNAATAANDTSLSTPDEEKIEQARRQLLATLRKVEALAQSLSDKERRRSERAAFLVRETLEKYVGLTLGARGISADARPAAREMELCRISGRAGDDLLLAGRCIHRRNVARLLAHRERARTHLLHALAEMRELTDDAFTHKNLAAARHTSVAHVRFYAHAINLLSLLEDEGASRGVARLLDAECARLRRLERTGMDQVPEATAGEERCTPHTHHLAFTGPSQTTPLPQG